jgi:hypothetical protein
MVWQPGQSGNPNGRPKGSVNKLHHMMRQSAELVLPHVLARALGGDFEAQKLILKMGMPRLKPVELPVEFSLAEGEAAPVRAIIQQAAAGEISLPHAEKLVYDLLPAVTQEQKALERQAQPSGGGGFFNAYLNSVLNG